MEKSEMEFRELMKYRAKQIGIETIHLIDELPHKPAAWVLAKQVLRSSTSIGSNYRSAYRAKSTPDFINKLKIVEEESDEMIYWLEILQDSGLVKPARIKALINETTEVLAITVSSIKSTRKRIREKSNYH